MKDVVWDDAYATAFQNFNTQAELTRVAVGRAIH